MAKPVANAMAQDPYRYFRPEARNLLDQFAQGVLDLENNGAGDGSVKRLLRLAHTLKGAARVVRQAVIAERAHAIEDALEPFRDGSDGVGRATVDVVLEHLDQIGRQLAELSPAVATDRGQERSAAPAPATIISADAPVAAIQAPRIVHAEIADVDAVLDGVAETHARFNQMRRCAQTIEEIDHLADLVRAHIASSSLAQELCRKIGNLAAVFGTAAAQADRELRQLRDAAEGLRLIAIDTVLVALQRTARDAAASLSKQVTFEATGGGIRLDADVLGVVQSALIQLVRNAVAHGIETVSERTAAGKAPAGRLAVTVTRRGSKIMFECIDDGRGIDLGAVRQAAVERGLLSPGSAASSDDDMIRLLLGGGISTAASVTDLSGRGVGLSVVRDALQAIGGEVAVRSEPGRGTTFQFMISRSVSAMAALLVAAEPGAGAVALPLDAVRRIVRLAPGEIASAATGASMLWEGEAVPFIPLAAALGGAAWPAGRAWTVLIVAGADGIAAIGIERLLGTARIVLRPLPMHCGASPAVAGAALDGEGNPQLMLDPDALVAAAQSRERDGGRVVDRQGPPAKRPVLVIDDSLTTRMLEKSILESAGYDVAVASSAEEGLDLARRKPFAVILCDVEMPGIDGFTFVERLRADTALRDTPAILVTSRNAPEDRRRGRDVGARGYIVKSEFNQADLLNMIRPMAG
jgi:two-component system chemotaxis sensor kinase CheA